LITCPVFLLYVTSIGNTAVFLFIHIHTYRETPEHGPNFLHPPPDIIDEEPEWEVEKILKECTFGRWKKKQYLVHWKGYSPAHDSWVSRDDMHAKELIVEFKEQGPSIKAALETEPDSMTTFHVPSPSPSTTSSEESHSTADTSLDTSDSDSAPFYTAPSTPTNNMANYKDEIRHYEFYSPDPHPFNYPIMYTLPGSLSPTSIFSSPLLAHLSPPAPGCNWMDWSHAWGGEMRLKKALEKLKLKYPHDSNG
jgi:hypothetical protein